MSLNLFFQIIIMVMVVVVVDLMDDILLCSFVGWLISESPSNNNHGDGSGSGRLDG